MDIDISQVDYFRKMTPDLWDRVEHFTPREKWGDPMEMKVIVVYCMDTYRKLVRRPVHIHAGYADGGHTPGSQHYVGNAVDFHVNGMSLLDQFIVATKIAAFNGIGVYPYWNNKGLHVDIRLVGMYEQRKYWCRDKEGRYHNLSSSVDFLT